MKKVITYGLLFSFAMLCSGAELRCEAEKTVRNDLCREFEHSRFAGKKGIAGEGAELTFQIQVPAAGRYRIVSRALVLPEAAEALKIERNNQSSPRLEFAVDGGEFRRPVAVFNHELHNPVRERVLASPVLETGLHTIRIRLPRELALDWVELRPFDIPTVPVAAAEYRPKVVPPAAHPRLFVTPAFLPELRRRMTLPENGPAYAKLLADAEKEARFQPRPGGLGNRDQELENTLQAKAFAYLVTGKKRYGEEAASGLREYLANVYFDNMTDVTRQIGRVILTGSLVFDWCHEFFTSAERKAVAARLVELAELTEIGHPPFRQMVVNGHGNEMQFTRDYLALGIAVYEENPLPYQYGTYRFLEEIVPMHGFEYRSFWHNQGVGYGIVRFSGDVIASLLYRRMAGYEAFGPELREVPYSWFYLRLPDGTMFRDGDDFYMTNQRGKYSSNYESTFLTAAYTGDPVLKGESYRQGMGDWELRNHVQFLLLNDPAVKPGSDYGHLPLTRLLPAPYPALLARTGWSMGPDSRDVIAFVKGANYQSVGHQHLDAGAFQLYYRGLQATDLGIYHHFGSPYDRNINKRSIAHNTLLVFDPKEDWGRLANDGGQQYFCGWPTGMSPGSLKEMFEKSKNGELLAAAGPDRQAPDFSFLKSDLAAAYGKKIEMYVRTALFLNFKNSDHPAALLIFDRVRRSDAGHTAYFLLNTLAEPKQTASRQLVSQYGQGQLTADFLLPDGPLKFDIATGPAARTVFGKEFTVPMTGLAEENGTRTMVSAPEERKKETCFLAILQPGDPGAGPLPVGFRRNGEVVELTVADRLVLLETGFGACREPLEFEVKESTSKVLFADFAPGKWVLNGRTVAIAPGENCLQLTLAPGKYRLERRD